jgi:hypothetical protein
MRRIEAPQAHFLKMVAGQRLENLKRNEDIRQELRLKDISTATKAIKLNGKDFWNHA